MDLSNKKYSMSNPWILLCFVNHSVEVGNYLKFYGFPKISILIPEFKHNDLSIYEIIGFYDSMFRILPRFLCVKVFERDRTSQMLLKKALFGPYRYE